MTSATTLIDGLYCLVGKDWGDIEISGTKFAIERFSDHLMTSAQGVLLFNKPPSALLNEHTQYIFSLSISIVDTKIIVSRSSSTLDISGAPTYFSMLANSVNGLSRTSMSKNPLGFHIHIEYPSNSEYVDKESEPLVITLLGRDATEDHSNYMQGFR